MVRSTAGRLAAASVAAIVMLAFAAGAGAQSTGMVKGKVTDSSGAPIADAKVSIVQKGNKSGREVKTGRPRPPRRPLHIPYCTRRIPQMPLALPNEAWSRNR